ncbi:MAG: DUF2309 domain-containing protein [Acidobacteriota bacterium]|nr:DUF2309 domain-containing protein [Acidobacteriota bacterium]
MNTLECTAETTLESAAAQHAIQVACARIAPTWPLDQLIAVNPYWGYIGQPMEASARQIEGLSGSRMLMPRAFYRERWRAGEIGAPELQQALEHSGLQLSMTQLLAAMDDEPTPAVRVPLATTVADAHRDLLHGMSNSDFVVHNISQHCASYFDQIQSSWETQHKSNLYQSWLHHARTDRSPRLLMGISGVRRNVATLPDQPHQLILQLLEKLQIPKSEWDIYLTALLMNINGWASWCAQQSWQARLNGQQDDHMVQLLAIRLAWDSFVLADLPSEVAQTAWQGAWQQWLASKPTAQHSITVDWVLQQALEMTYQHGLCRALQGALPAATTPPAQAPAVQAVFCIDVRSEVYRRALESCSPSVQTLGFAGFFGLPIRYAPLGAHAARPQLPGLLAPRLSVSDTTGSMDQDLRVQRARQRSLRLSSLWKEFRASSTSTFTFVESCGLFYAAQLLQQTLGRPTNAHNDEHPALRPQLTSTCNSSDSTQDALHDLLAGILTNMSLTTGFARLLLLVGHGSQTENNPHAAGLDCGACGGQTGEVNARVLAGLLNQSTVRVALRSRGIDLPDTTCVVAGLHNTTTDEVRLFDTELVPASHTAELAQLRQWLQDAGHTARLERAEALRIPQSKASTPASLLQQFRTRSQDWSQVRPEWGLANNAAFLIAPRSRSRSRSLQGRVFLHEYRCDLDPHGTVLESIMTAPMLVTNWINMQYYASTVDNRLYGSGNKVLHNVVGGRIGVFEGNGGDLRIGLPLQSLHDGATLRHTPLRLSVLIEAPQASMDAVLGKHEVVRHLVHHGWLHLFRICPNTGAITQHVRGSWTPVADATLPASGGGPQTDGRPKPKLLKGMVGTAGFEPTTSTV